MKINYSDINNIDLFKISKLMPRKDQAKIMNGAAGQEHYKLLAYLSLSINNARIVELGTHNGASCLALSINPTNIIRTYDVRDLFLVEYPPANIFRVMGNIFDIKEEHFLLESDFIFVDTAHTGDFEWQVYEYLHNNGYKGFVIFDDIHWSDDMINFWNKIPDKYKHDITDIGHGNGLGPSGNTSGTGLIDFSGNVHIIKS